ncbi:MAG TPA: helix-turn-helix transcriptional regulator [Gemmatimonadales bacterium]|nr:helix-turn-helix transcriptional regulator [Gemmatimonadales bacterium]
MTTTATPSVRTPEGFRAWRLAHGLSQPQLAELLGLSTKIIISRYENGHSPITRIIELALVGLDQELRNATPLVSDAAADLILALCREAGDDVSDVGDTIEAFTANHNAADVEAAASGDLRALILLRKACGLPAFR